MWCREKTLKKIIGVHLQIGEIYNWDFFLIWHIGTIHICRL